MQPKIIPLYKKYVFIYYHMKRYPTGFSLESLTKRVENAASMKGGIMKKTFLNLIQDVLELGECHQCGGCVAFCSAMNYGALAMDDNGLPFYKNIDKCNECGLCYSICPQTHELDGEIKQNAQWEQPMGHVISFNVTRANDPAIRQRGTDGGVVTAILCRLLNMGKIDGAIVSRPTPKGRVPFLAKTESDIMASAGSHFGSSQGINRFARDYATFSPSISALSEIKNFRMDRIAFVGTPCQINTIRKMQALRIVPSDAVSLCLGLFCSGNYSFQTQSFADLEKKYQFAYARVKKINVKNQFVFTLDSGKKVFIPLEELKSVRRTACGFCQDFSAEYADISFGGLGAENGWTTAIDRTPEGRAVFEDALKNVLTSFRVEEKPHYITQAEKKIHLFSKEKKENAHQNLAARKKGIFPAR